LALNVAVLGVGAVLGATLLLVYVFAIAYSNLPPIDSLADYRPKIPLLLTQAPLH